MTPEEIKLVRDSFERIERVSEEAAVLFYARLFETDPSLRKLFKVDIKDQGYKLMQMLETAVNGLDDLDALLPAVRALGTRHKGYGVEDRNYDAVRDALLWTFEKTLDVDHSAEVVKAWSTVYDLLAETMKDACDDEILQGSAAPN